MLIPPRSLFPYFLQKTASEHPSLCLLSLQDAIYDVYVRFTAPTGTGTTLVNQVTTNPCGLSTTICDGTVFTEGSLSGSGEVLPPNTPAPPALNPPEPFLPPSPPPEEFFSPPPPPDGFTPPEVSEVTTNVKHVTSNANHIGSLLLTFCVLVQVLVVHPCLHVYIYARFTSSGVQLRK
jgi:hypothetical protein